MPTHSPTCIYVFRCVYACARAQVRFLVHVELGMEDVDEALIQELETLQAWRAVEQDRFVEYVTV